ncbi:MAG TPA: NAD(P)/FAD-dependent oxidoreductase [Vicinamibacterales bacterium]
MKIAIVGGGLTGVSLGYFLAREGASVDIFEASPVLGGLAGPLVLEDGTAIDRFYHAILPSDDHLRELCQELGIEDQLRFQQTKNAFFVEGGIHSMNSAVEFLGFKPLTPLERVRLATTVVRAQLVRDWQSLESISVEQWLRRWSGNGTFSKLWHPLLAAKFDGDYGDVPATWMWSRLVRMKSTRSGANQRESAGHLVGGYATLLAAMATRIRAAGGRIHLNCPVQEIVVEHRRVAGVRLGREFWSGGPVISTMQAPVFRRLIPGAPDDYQQSLSAVPYLGIVCPLIVLERPLSGYWTLNIADTRVPFTGIIETTAYIDPKYVGGHHLVYMPKYTAPGSHWQTLSDADILEVAMASLKQIVPEFDRRAVRYALVHRERYVEPLHYLGSQASPTGVETPVDGLYLATTSQIYPALTNGEAIARHARNVSALILRHPSEERAPALVPHAVAAG